MEAPTSHTAPSASRTDKEKAPLSQTEIARILTECRQDFSAETGSLIEQLFLAIDQSLEQQLLMETSSEARKILQTLQQACQEKRNLIASRFRERFLKAYEMALLVTLPDEAPQTDTVLELVDNETMEEDLVTRHVEWMLSDVCAENLQQIDRRMPTLVGDIKHHPLSPRLVISALRDACKDVIPEAKLRLQLFRNMGTDAAQAFQTAYQNVGQRIITRVPEPRLRAVKNPNQGRSPQATAPDGTANPAAQMAMGQNAAAGNNNGNIPVTSANTLLQPVSHELLARLDALIARHPSNADTNLPPVPVNPSTGVSLDLESVIQRINTIALPEAGTANHNYVRDLKTNVATTALPATESIIIDVIAMMFDYIFDDPDIASEVKGVIGRLQMPVLKIALADKAFFSNKRHPARYLVDRIAELASEYAEGSPEAARLFEQFDSIADTIQSSAEADLGAFEKALTSLKHFIETDEENNAAASLRMSQELARAEELAQKKKLIRAGLAEKLSRVTVPMSVSHFILNQWVDYIITLQGKKTDTEQTKKLDSMLDDLLWTVTPKTSAGELALLTRLIPVVINGINVCLDTIGAFPHERQKILESLRSLHLENLKRKRRPKTPKVVTVTPEIVAEKKAPPPVETEPPPPVLPENLGRGALLDFLQEGKMIRARLNWISPSRSKFIFTSHAIPAFGLSAEELAEELNSRHATLVSQVSGPIMDKVVEKAIGAVE